MSQQATQERISTAQAVEPLFTPEWQKKSDKLNALIPLKVSLKLRGGEQGNSLAFATDELTHRVTIPPDSRDISPKDKAWVLKQEGKKLYVHWGNESDNNKAVMTLTEDQFKDGEPVFLKLGDSYLGISGFKAEEGKTGEIDVFRVSKNYLQDVYKYSVMTNDTLKNMAEREFGEGASQDANAYREWMGQSPTVLFQNPDNPFPYALPEERAVQAQAQPAESINSDTRKIEKIPLLPEPLVISLRPEDIRELEHLQEGMGKSFLPIPVLSQGEQQIPVEPGEEGRTPESESLYGDNISMDTYGHIADDIMGVLKRKGVGEKFDEKKRSKVREWIAAGLALLGFGIQSDSMNIPDRNVPPPVPPAIVQPGEAPSQQKSIEDLLPQTNPNRRPMPPISNEEETSRAVVPTEEYEIQEGDVGLNNIVRKQLVKTIDEMKTQNPDFNLTGDLEVLRGILVYASGDINKINPDSIQVGQKLELPKNDVVKALIRKYQQDPNDPMFKLFTDLTEGKTSVSPEELQGKMEKVNEWLKNVR